MQRAAKMGRAERSRLLEDDAENTIIPLNQAILLWYESSYREELKVKLQNTAMKIRLEKTLKLFLQHTTGKISIIDKHFFIKLFSG